MALTLIFLIFTTFSAIEAQQRSPNISLSSTLTPTSTNSSSWLSPSGLYAFGFYPQGSGYAVGIFAAGIPEKTVVWTANRDDPPVQSNATLAFIEGSLVLNQNPVIADVSQSISAASMLDSGNFVLYNSVRAIIWQSFGNPTDTILPGQRLVAEQNLISSVSEGNHSSGLFRLKMQSDGHLVAYPLESQDTAPYAYWASGTNGDGENITLNLAGNGHLYLLNTTGANIVKNLTEGESSNDTRCGWNLSSLFTYLGIEGQLNDNEANCRCLPGFNFVNPKSWTLGCERDYAAVSCDTTNGSRTIKMEKLDNMLWEDESYTVSELPNKEDCEQSCLEDCHCEVAFYSEGKYCQKQKLPLRYGRRSLTSSKVAFIKVQKEDQVLAPKGTKKEMRLEIILIIGASLTTFFFVVLTVSGCLIYRNRVWVYKKISEQGHIEFGGDIVLRTFKFAELEEVTNGFREELGRGASGTVYKGVIPYNQKLPITVKADVYSFGVVLLEIICGRKCLDWSRSEDEAVLEDWVYDCFEAKDLGKLVGHEEEVDKRKLERMVKVALWCIQDEPSLRPSMKKVLLMIEGTVDIPTPPSPTSFLSAI
ncbi:hypothetical protein Vadar_001872 [Vaccinium darrowii]|uniref:Uncharacterized protein n=1 Tax=Vaccinium darrowii TaxID=229202 RepID=A0ACB7Z0Q6_9ERIC|nr:hypothetical protein Vadar_001872 [Vaccinium darrowii]